jgi:SAM-dependent methyltransferase
MSMKVRDSGMPEEAYWESLFDIPLILDSFAIGTGIGDVVEFGCGYGTFTVPVARRISGLLHALDIEPDMVAGSPRRGDDDDSDSSPMEEKVCPLPTYPA